MTVRRRTRQTGTGRAPGATRGDIPRDFLAENAWLTSIGLSVGVVVSCALNLFAEARFDLARIAGKWLRRARLRSSRGAGPNRDADSARGSHEDGLRVRQGGV